MPAFSTRCLPQPLPLWLGLTDWSCLGRALSFPWFLLPSHAQYWAHRHECCYTWISFYFNFGIKLRPHAFKASILLIEPSPKSRAWVLMGIEFQFCKIKGFWCGLYTMIDYMDCMPVKEDKFKINKLGEKKWKTVFSHISNKTAPAMGTKVFNTSSAGICGVLSRLMLAKSTQRWGVTSAAWVCSALLLEALCFMGTFPLQPSPSPSGKYMIVIF